MAKNRPVYPRSIWSNTTNYALDSSLSNADLKTISRLTSVNAAKLRVPPILPAGLLNISQKARALPSNTKVEPKDVEGYLREGSKQLGAGILTLMCMLAVEKRGTYPPMDRKFANGLLKQKIIDSAEKKILTGGSIKKFAEVYVSKVIPVWQETRKTRSAKKADEYWGRGGQDEE